MIPPPAMLLATALRRCLLEANGSGRIMTYGVSGAGQVIEAFHGIQSGFNRDSSDLKHL